MKRFWDTLVEPMLEAARSKSIVEIGSFKGENTRNLLDFCERTDAVLHVVDPAPRYDVDELRARYGERLVFHEALSLDALKTIDGFDAVLIDGDHNWFTVFHELRLIEERCVEFPLVVLHDIFWPFGRRDMYYGPETIPEPYRKPHEPKGVRPGEKELLEEGGLGQGLEKALEEGGPRNGVLTGVEDFLKETERDLELVTIPGFHGIGLLFPARLKEDNEEFAKFLRVWNLPPGVRAHAENLERAWLESEIYRLHLHARLNKLQKRQEELKSRQEAKNERLTKSLTKKNERLTKKNERLTGENERLTKKNERLIGENARLTKKN